MSEAAAADPVAEDPAPPTEPEATATGAPPVGRGERALLIVGFLGLAAAVVGTRWGVFTPDTQPDLYQDPGGFLRSTVDAWIGGVSGMGQGNFNAGAAPVGAVVWVIRRAASPWLAVRIWRLALLVLGAWGIRRYLGTLMGPRLTVQARVLATVFWVVNPYVIVAGSTTPILLPYALLPWTMLAFVRATRSPRSWRWPALFALAFAAQTGLNAGVVPFFSLLALPGHLIFARWVESARWRDLVRVVWRSGLCTFVVSLYWILPSLVASGTGAGIAGGTEDPYDVARTSSYAETARLLGNWPMYGRAGDRLFLDSYTVYLTSPWVLAATFLVPLAVVVALWLTRARERVLVVGLIGVALPVMVGLFPPDDPSPAGRLLGEVFDRVPAALAFRTTNKVGAVVVLAEVVALAVGWRAWQLRSRDRRRPVRMAAVAAVALVLAAISAPLWNGGLYPLGYTIPDRWHDATRDLDAAGDRGRVLVVPGGTGGNYRWGMRSPDDLFPSLLDRPIAARNTVVGRGDPAGNVLSAFDTALAQGRAGDGVLSTWARYVGAGDVLVRNDLLTEEIGGPAPWQVVDQADDDPGLELVETYGRPGTDTVPGASGRPTRAERRADPADARVDPLVTYEVVDPVGTVRLADAADQVLVVGDGEAMVELADAGIVDGRQPVRLVGDLDDDEFAAAVAQGGRIVLTDTNRRRAWDANRTANATSPTLEADEDIDAGTGTTTTRWPDRPDDQTVAVVTGGATVGATDPDFGLQPYGRPANAFDGDPSTAWITGGFGTAAGDRIWIELPEPTEVEQVTITPYATEPSSVTAVRVRVGDREVLEAISGEDPIPVQIEPGEADRVEVTILEQSGGDNPVGIAEIDVDGTTVRPVARLPLTLQDRAAAADAATRDQLAALPLDVVLTRARGSVLDAGDDEEAQLDRRFELPDDRTFSFAAELGAFEVDPDLVAQARAGERPCVEVARIDGDPVLARIASDRRELATGRLTLEGCDELPLEAGRHDLRTVFGWRLDRVHLASPGDGADGVEGSDGASADGGGAVRVVDESATALDLEVDASGGGDRLLRIGRAYDDRWTLAVDGTDAGPPIVVDGYSAGWVIDGDAHRLEVRFAPQRVVEVAFVASAVGLVVVVAAAVGLIGDRPRRRDDDAEPEPTPTDGGAP